MDKDKPNLPQISDAEWEVMKVVWDRGPLTAGEVVQGLQASAEVGPARDWHPRTIKTLLNRLVKKRAVEVKVDGRRYLYRPRVKREQCVREESRSFLSRVFGGAVAPAVVHFLENCELSPQDVEQLRQILEREQSQGRGARG